MKQAVDMKRSTKICSIGIACLAVLCLVGCCSRGLRQTSPMHNLFFPPDNLYDTLDQTTFSTSVEGKSYTLEFTAKYPGHHDVDVISAKPVKVLESYGETFAVTITIVDMSGNVLIEKDVSPPYPQFWGDKVTGFRLLRFDIPKDAPQNTKLRASVLLKTTDDKLEETFGPISLRVKKASDE